MPDEIRQAVQAWLRKAENDLRGARVDLDAEPPLIEDALFHCQQAAEKAMKAFLTANGVAFRKTHDLDELASVCAQIDASLKDALDPARDLTAFAWEFHYPGPDEAPPKAEAQDALLLAQAAVDTIRERLKRFLEAPGNT